MKVDVLVTAGTAPALALKNATVTIPIVVATMGDPLGTEHVGMCKQPITAEHFAVADWNKANGTNAIVQHHRDRRGRMHMLND